MTTPSANPDSLHNMLASLEASATGETEFSEAWSQGRSAFGGLSAAFATTAMRQLLSGPKPIRSLMVSFIAPVPPGPVRTEARIQREGRSVTQMAADLYVGEQLCLQAMGVFGHGRPSRRVQAERPIDMAPPDSGIAFDTHARQLPSFLHFFEGSWVNGVMPFTGQSAREMKFWVRHRELMTDFPVERLVTLADIPPPVILSHYRTPPVPSSSLSWSLEFVKDPATVETDWCYLEFDLEAAAEGYTQQSGRLYDEQGDLLVLSRQCMVFFEPKANNG